MVFVQIMDATILLWNLNVEHLHQYVVWAMENDWNPQ